MRDEKRSDTSFFIPHPSKRGGVIMGNDVMGLEELATYLQRDVREVSKMASRGYLPGQKVGGEWRFASAEINYWIETQLPTYTEKELAALETGTSGANKTQRLLTAYLS